MTAIKTQIVRIGNSQGIRLSKAIMKQCHLSREVLLEPHDDALVIKPVKTTRKDWNKQFQEMALNHEDTMLEPSVSTQWDQEEWVW
ncbi:MAG: AbrB/MazE/SpoVT family DNA-binding domain-containing protein [SAR324 cluster bacterium]|nr:AbrB/MazE/SpoVT family DNA-binding domain-containing protein [SAR324 cluster bacterium]MBF0349911.1 AbrB/MazE/SpoVT family DNA-binding domain-containing protein [SAR324 cluster bacterium]